MNLQKWGDNPPFWLVPRVIRDNASPGMVAAWFAAENQYCLQKLKWSTLAAGVLLLLCIYLDVTYTPPADFYYAFLGRGFLALLSLVVFTWLAVQRECSTPRFIIYKTAFALFVLACVVYQLKYSIDYTNRARYVPPFMFVIGMYALRIGPSFSAILTLLYVFIVGSFLLIAPQNSAEDLNLIVLAGLAVFFFQSRIQYEARYFVAEWKDKERMALSERDAKLSASSAYRELVKLVYPHVVDLVQAGHSIEQTMPVGRAEAAVLCFDIADSSIIQHEDFDDAVENFQARLYALMCGHYDGKSLIANGYRIKDVGDGVFYSVGFPFKAPADQSSCDAAVDLAQGAVEIFHEEMAKLQYPTPITCGVGISFGQVEGFFPKAGQKQYDLRGRAIVLATRYQELRKAIKAKIKQTSPSSELSESSLIVLDQSVYNELTRNQQRFQAFDLPKNRIMVRNDPNASFAFWQAISHHQTSMTSQEPCAITLNIPQSPIVTAP